MVCHVCGKKGAKKCTGCKAIAYCSTECQKKDWSKHKTFCKMMQAKNAEADARTKSLNMATGLGRYTPLVKAAMEGNLKKVRKYLKKGEDINGRDSAGGTALHGAAVVVNYDMCKLLLDNGADVNATTHMGTTPLDAMTTGARLGRLQVGRKQFEKVEALLKERGGKIFDNPMGSPDEAVASRIVLDAASRARMGKVDEYESNSTAAYEKGFNTNYDDVTPLIKAIDDGDMKTVYKLLHSGADANERDTSAASALHLAASVANYEICKLLIDYGADVNSTAHMSGMTPLGNLELISRIPGVGISSLQKQKVEKLLKKHGAKMNNIDRRAANRMASGGAFGGRDLASLMSQLGQ